MGQIITDPMNGEEVMIQIDPTGTYLEAISLYSIGEK
jgi:hypothetical protein